MAHIKKGMIGMKNRLGFTLVEIIVSLAIIGIIAVAMIPVFGLQLKMTLDTKNLTSGVFEAQAEMENTIYTLKEELRVKDLDSITMPGLSVEQVEDVFNIPGRNVTMSAIKMDFPLNSNKNFLVLLSKRLAIDENSQLVAPPKGVAIEVSGETVHQIADLKKSPLPTLQGIYDMNTDEKWYANLYRWYVSKEGDPDPSFPEDYTRISIPGVVPDYLNNLLRFANRYIVFTVTPVDIHGVRGNEVRSSNAVYILGKEWRTGLFAWVDKDEDTSFAEETDIKVEKSINWPLNTGFDTDDTFADPYEPTNTLDPGDGSLYVPMGIDRQPGKRVGPIVATGTQKVDWTVDKGIHLATDVQVTNNTDATLNAEDGSVILYQYVDINSYTGDAIFESNGMVRTVDYGASIATSYGSISLTTTGRGNVVMQNFTALNSGADISLIPYGNILLYEASLQAKGSITLNSSSGTTFPGNRDILVKDTLLRLTSNLDNKAITIQSKNKLNIDGSDIQGYSGKRGTLNLTALEGISFKNTDIAHLEVRLNQNAIFQGGGWDNDSIIIVPNGKNLSVGTGDGPVNNQGQLILGETGGVNFTGTMEGDLENPLQLNLSKGTGTDEVILTTNYGRVISYADAGSNTITAMEQGSYQNLGSGASNLEYTIEKRTGIYDAAMTCTFDGTDKIQISASGTGPISSYYRLTVQDKYAEDVNGIILFHVSAGEGESPVVTVIGAELPKRTVTFDKNGGTSDPNPLTITVDVGSPLGTLPTPPTRLGGWWFNSWTTAVSGGDPVTTQTLVSNDFTAYAQWSKRFSFANIEIGEYVKINDVYFQKIGEDRLLARELISENQRWSNAGTDANNFKSSKLSGVAWVIESGLVNGTDLLLLETTHKNSILRRNYNWWGGAASQNNRAHLVGTNGTVTIVKTNDKNNRYSTRPFIRVNTTDLYIVSGTGTAGDPYILSN